MASDNLHSTEGTGATDMHITIPSKLLRFRDLHPSKPAMVTFDRDFKESKITFEELATKSARFAYALRLAGFERNDVIANTLPVSLERLVTDLGIMMAGGVGVGARTTLATGELFFSTLNRCRCKGVVATPDLDSTEWHLLKEGMDEFSNPEDIYRTYKSTTAPTVKTLLVVTRQPRDMAKISGIPDFSSFLEGFNDEYIGDVTADDPAYIYSTSGSTGLPKLLVRSHSLLVQTSEVISGIILDTFKSVGYDDRPVLWNNHSFDLLAGFPSLLYGLGSTLVALDQMTTFSDDMFGHYWHAMATCHVVGAHMTSLEIEKLVKSKSDVKFTIPAIFIGGMPMTDAVVKTALGVAMVMANHYGSAEMGSVSFGTLRKEEDFVLGEVGEPVKGCRVRIVHNSGNILEHDQTGHIEVSSPWLIGQYLDAPDLLLESYTKDGWFKSGDMGYVTKQGRLRIMGRSDDAILYGPYTIFPAPIERILARCAGVGKVVVVPVPDPISHHKLCACVIKSCACGSYPLQSEQQLLDFMRGQLSDPPNPYTPIPHHVIFMSEFPVVAYSKVNRKELSRMAEAMLNV